MGQLFSSIRSKLLGKGWRKRQLRKFTDAAFDRFRADSHEEKLSFEELYIAVLYVYNDINKYLPGPHNDPPSKDHLKALMQKCDVNLDGMLDREEFAELMQKLTADTVISIGQNMLVKLVLFPAGALLAKKATEGVPVVSKLAQNWTNIVAYASVLALGALLFHNSTD